MTDTSVNQRVREAVARIEPLPFSKGPNFWTVDVDGWGLSAPTRRELNKMLWDWFAQPEPPAIVAIFDAVATALETPRGTAHD